MEIKITLSVDDRTATLIEGLTQAILASKAVTPRRTKTPEPEAKPVVIEPEHVVPVEEPKLPEAPVAETPEAPKDPEPAKPETAKKTDADVRVAVTEAKNRVGSDRVKAVITSFGAKSVSAISPDLYDAVIKKMEELS